MYKCSFFSVVTVLTLLCDVLPVAASDFRLVSELSLNDSTPGFGGWSGIEVFDAGTKFIAISDKGRFLSGQIQRSDGNPSAVGPWVMRPIRQINGENTAGFTSDAEGLARSDTGEIFVSFEGFHRVRKHHDVQAAAQNLPAHGDFKGFQSNSALEALAIDTGGRLYTLPERSGKLDRPFQVYRLDAQGWTRFAKLARRGDFLPVGADFGPDGLLYLLERDVKILGGFATRIRRFEFAGNRIRSEEVVLQTNYGEHDNLEGISVWRDGKGALRLTMVADDNFHPLQSGQIVEYVDIEGKD